MQNPHGVTVVLVAPRAIRITIREHHHAFGLDLVFFKIVVHALETGPAATGDFVITDGVKIV
jgi:hypothetical protein